MSCSNCGDSGSCGSCADSCNSCNGPKVIITKQGLPGADGSTITVENEGTPLTTDVSKMNFVGDGVTVTDPATDEMLITIPGGGGDTFSYYTTSSDSVDIDALFVTPANINLTVDTGKAFVAGDFIRMSDIAGFNLTYANYIEGIVVSYNASTGALVFDGATNSSEVNTGGAGVAYKKMVGTGVIDSWFISLIDAKIISVPNDSTLVYHALKTFEDVGTTYIETTNSNLTDLSQINTNVLILDSADTDVTVLLNKKNSHFEILDETLGHFRGDQIKAIEVHVSVPKSATNLDWITPVNISGTDVYRTGIFSVIKHPLSGDYASMGNLLPIKTLQAVPVGENTGSISLEGVQRNFEEKTDFAGSGPEGFKFKIINDTDSAIVGGIVSYPGGQSLSAGKGSYSIKVFI